jgi:hypothetical protein
MYNEAGAIRVDAVDGTGFLAGATSGSVDSSLTGTYTLEYSKTDRAGNTGTTTRTVYVLDSVGDDDGDGYTNEEEINNGTDPTDTGNNPKLTDTTAPLITLGGLNPLFLLSGATYIEK